MSPLKFAFIFSFTASIILLILYLGERGTKQELKAERDSLLNEAQHLQTQQEISSARIYELEEQIAIQDQVLQNRELEALKAKEGENKIRKQYESLKRLHFSSNAQRDSIRAVLYPPGYHF